MNTDWAADTKSRYRDRLILALAACRLDHSGIFSSSTSLLQATRLVEKKREGEQARGIISRPETGKGWSEKVLAKSNEHVSQSHYD